jgi:molybdopterin/thiamine biosynthesis adenylyltransferase/rhodanese-related sulfurtransferase
VQPLVEPAAELTTEEVVRYSRHLLLPDVGREGQRRLKNARVLVVGAGGLGSPVLMYLAAAGVGTIGIVDDDLVEESNLQRQVIHGQVDVGRAKVDSAAESIAAINPRAHVVPHHLRLAAANALQVIAGYDLVLDGTDTFATRYLVNDACAVLRLPLVWGSIFRFDGQVSVFWSSPPAGPDGIRADPVTYRDVHPVPPPPGSVPSCAEAGVLGVVCAAIGSVMATEAVKLICGIGEPLLGRLMVFDALAMSWRTIRVRPAPGTRPITRLDDDYDAFCGLPAAAGTGADRGSEALASTISVTELAGWLGERDRGERDFVLIDVREPAEREIAAIPGAVSVPLRVLEGGEAGAVLKEAAGGRRIVFHCKSGARSARALELARAAGLFDAVYVPGGMLAWIDEVDPGQPRY